MIDATIKNFNDFEKIDEAVNNKYMPSYYECYMVTFTAYEDDYDEGESSKAYTYETVEDNIKAPTLDELLRKVASDYSHWIPEPINKDHAYYNKPCICCTFGPVDRNWERLSKVQINAWKEGTFTAYSTYVNIYIRKIIEVPKAEAYKYVGIN